MPLGRVQHGSKTYSLGLRRKIVEAKERGMSIIEVIRNFRVGLSCVKRYAKTGAKRVRCAREETRAAVRWPTSAQRGP
jgi:hypothetical protein